MTIEFLDGKQNSYSFYKMGELGGMSQIGNT